MVKTLSLEDCHLYAIDSPVDLARRLGTSVSTLESLANADDGYKLWTNKDGREVEEPRPELQRLHAKVHRYLSRVMAPTFLHSPVKHRSYVTNAKAHTIGGPSVKIDIRKFFQSVPKAAVRRFFREDMRCKGDAAEILAKLLTFNGHLPTGSSSSPILAYYGFRRMFGEIAAYADANGLIVTCYVDDITVTGSVNLGQTVRELQSIIARAGLRSHKVKMFPAGRAKIITGVVVEGALVKLPNKRHRAIAAKFDELDAAVTADEELGVLNGLLSRLHEAGMIEPAFKARARSMERRRKEVRQRLANAPAGQGHNLP